jgi:hypothetical protein
MASEYRKKELEDFFTNLLESKIIIENLENNPEAIEKDRFINLITLLDLLLTREEDLLSVYKLDVGSFYDHYWTAIETLISLYYSEDQKELILWYLYERFDENNNIIPLFDEANPDEEIIVDTPEMLYYLINREK